eukprot:1427178-Rhodomonas_salina.2
MAEMRVGMSLLLESEETLARSCAVSIGMLCAGCGSCCTRRCFQSASRAEGRLLLSASSSSRHRPPIAESLIATSATACATAPRLLPKESLSSSTRSETSLLVTSSVMMQPSAQMSSFSLITPVLCASGLQYGDSILRFAGLMRDMCRMSYASALGSVPGKATSCTCTLPSSSTRRLVSFRFRCTTLTSACR